MVAVWKWKASDKVRLRLEQVTGHRVSVAGVSINHRLEIVIHDMAIAGSPPFDSQILARAEQVVVRLRGPGGFWSPSEIRIDGLDIDYLGTSMGDNLRATPPAAPKASAANKSSRTNALPSIVAHNVRVRGSIALAHAPRIEFRVPQATIERKTDGSVRAEIENLVVDAEGWGSLRAIALSGGYDHHQVSFVSGGRVSVEVPGGGTLMDKLTVTGVLSPEKADIQIRRGDTLDTPATPAVFTGHWRPGTLDLNLEIQDVPLRALSVAAVNRALGLEHAMASMHASVVIDHTRADFAFEGKVQGIDLLHPAVDLAPWRNQSGTLRLRGQGDLAAGRVELTDGDLKVLGAPLSFSGWVESAQAPRGSLTVFTPHHAPMSCAALLIGQPTAVKQALAGLELDGKLGFRASVAFDASALENLDLDVTVDPLCEVRHEANALTALLPALLKPAAKDPSPYTLPLGPLHPDFVPLPQMPRHLTAAFLTSEDSKFFRHHGFDVDMIRHALAQDLENRSFDRGASTITQQLAKNLFLSHRRTLARKLEEAVLTWRLQKLLTKDRVLELYLNVIELGPGIRGVKQAAQIYFGKDVSALTPMESAHLAALTPNPHVLARRFRDGQVDEGWQQRLYDLLGMMKRHGRLSAADLATARTSRLILRDLSQDVSSAGTH